MEWRARGLAVKVRRADLEPVVDCLLSRPRDEILLSGARRPERDRALVVIIANQTEVLVEILSQQFGRRVGSEDFALRTRALIEEGRRQTKLDFVAAVEWRSVLSRSFGTLAPAQNITGEPAISLPLYWNAAGLPIGVQLVAPWAREDLLIRIAAELEQARPWRIDTRRFTPRSERALVICREAPDGLDDSRGVGGRAERGRDTARLHRDRVARGDDGAAQDDRHVEVEVAKSREELVEILEILPRVTRQADHVDALLQGGRGDALGQIEAAQVDDLHAGVAQQARDRDRAGLVLVHAEHAEQDAWCGRRHHATALPPGENGSAGRP